MKKVLGLIAVAGLAAVANAQPAGSGKLSFEVSTDGGTTWGMTAEVLPGANVKVRLVANFDGAGVAGLASLDLGEVQFNGADATDGLSAATIVDNIPNTTTNSTASDARRGIFNIPGGRKLDTTNTASTNPLSSSNRLKWGQLSNSLVSGLPINPDFKGGFPVEVFRIDFVAGTAGPGGRSVTTGSLLSCASGGYLGITAGKCGFNVFPGTLTPGTSLVSTPINESQVGTAMNATIRIVPTPASLALLGLGGLVAGRRRR